MRPDPRTEPKEFSEWSASEHKRLSALFKCGKMTEAVYRASLHCLGWRGQDISTEVNINFPEKRHWIDAIAR